MSTDSGNEINGSSTPGLVQVQASSVLEETASSGNNSVRVFDSRLFSIGDTITVGFGGSSPDTSLSISTIDHENGIIDFSPSLANTHEEGAIVRKTSGTGRILEQKTDPNTTSAHPDETPRFWQGDESRGSALTQSKETFGERDDLNIKSVKDLVDYYSAHLHEVRWGSLRPSNTSPGAPTSFSTNPRYWENAGGVAGARTATFTIGDGTNSWGDYNGTDEQPFLDAASNFPADGGTIYVKDGTYTLGSAVTFTSPVSIIGAGRDRVTIEKDFAAGPGLVLDSSSTSDVFEISGIRFEITATATDSEQISVGDGIFIIEDITMDDCGIISAAGTVQSLRINNSILENTAGLGTDRAINIDSTQLQYSEITNSILRADDEAIYIDAPTQLLSIYNNFIIGNVGIDFGSSTTQAVTISSCLLFSVEKAVEATGTLSGFTMRDNIIQTISAPASSPAIEIGPTTKSSISDNYFACAFASPGTSGSPSKILEFTSGTVTDLVISGNFFSNTNASDIVAGIYLDSCDYSDSQISVQSCTFSGCHYGIRTINDVSGSRLNISNVFIDGRGDNNASYGIRSNPAGDISISVSNSYIENLYDSSFTSYGIAVDNSSGSAYLTVSNCFIDSIVSDSSIASGITITGSAQQHDASISNCTISNITGDTSNGVYLNGTNSSQHISGCVFDDIDTTVGNSYGVRVNECFSSSIDNNIFLLNSSVAGDSYNFLVEGSSARLHVTNNEFKYRVVPSSSSGTNNLIVSNNIWNAASFTDSLLDVTLVNNDNNISVTGNSMTMSLGNTYGILVDFGSSDVINGLSVDNNIITNISGGGILIENGPVNALSVCNNTLRENGGSASDSAIEIKSGGSASASGSISNNTFDSKLGGSTHGSPAIFLSNMFSITINGNVVSNYEGLGLDISDVSVCTINDNSINATIDPSIQISSAASTIVSGNVATDNIDMNGTNYNQASVPQSVSTNLFGFNLVI